MALTVADPEGHALADCAVDLVAVLAEGTVHAGSARCDAQGRARVEGLLPGEHLLVVRAPGRERSVRGVRLLAGDNAQSVALGPGVGIAGTVRNGEAGVAGLVLYASREGGGAELPFAARSDASGRFEFTGLGPGTWRVWLEQPGYERVERRAVPAPVRELALGVRPLARLDGVVRGIAGSEPVFAVVSGSGLWPPRSLPVDAQGHFAMPSGLPGGVYEVRARQGERIAEPVAPLLLSPGGQRSVNLELTDGLALAGLVVDAASGRPVGRARVVLAEDALSTEPRALTAGEDGAFRAAGLLRRPHLVSARAEGYVPRVSVLATPGGEPVRVALDREVVLEGEVTDTRGRPVAGAQVEVRALDLDGNPVWLTAAATSFRESLFERLARGPQPLRPAGELGVTAGPVPGIHLAGTPGAAPSASAAGWVTDAQGRFRVREVPPGVLRVAVTHPLYVRGETAQRQAQAGESVSVALALHAGGVVLGRVTDGRGFPVPQQLVEVRMAGDPTPRRAFAQRDGSFRVPGVLGPASVVAVVGGRVAARVEVDVGDEGEVRADLVLEGSAHRVRGRVVDTRGFPVPQAELTLAAAGRAGTTGRALSAADGTYDVWVLGAGPYELTARHPAFALRTMRLAALGDSVPVELDAGGTVLGEVRASTCGGAAAAELRTSCGPLRRTLTSGVGVLRFEHVCAGRVTLSVQAAGCVGGARSGSVSTARDTQLEVLELVAGGGVEGRAVDGEGVVVPGATVHRAGEAEEGPGTARTDRQGSFVVEALPDGDVSVVASHPLLGTSRAEVVRVLRGTRARGVELRFERALRGAEAALGELPVRLVEREGGVYVASVRAQSAAARAGLQAGDEVLRVGGAAVRGALDAGARMRRTASEELVLEVRAAGRTREVRFAGE